MLASPFNLCNLPPWAIASRNCNRHPQSQEIHGAVYQVGGIGIGEEADLRPFEGTAAGGRP